MTDDTRIEHEVHYVEQRSGGGRFVWGMIAAVILIAGAVGAWLLLSEEDDDGTVNIPSVSVDADVDADPATDG